MQVRIGGPSKSEVEAVAQQNVGSQGCANIDSRFNGTRKARMWLRDQHKEKRCGTEALYNADPVSCMMSADTDAASTSDKAAPTAWRSRAFALSIPRPVQRTVCVDI